MGLIRSIGRYFWHVIAAIGFVGIALLGLSGWWRRRRRSKARRHLEGAVELARRNAELEKHQAEVEIEQSKDQASDRLKAADKEAKDYVNIPIGNDPADWARGK